MRLRRGCSGWWIALLAAAADRASKAAVARLWEASILSQPARRRLIPGVLNLRMATNRGAAFSMFSGQTAALAALTLAVIALILVWLIARPGEHPLQRAGLWMIVGGGLGNLYDRLVRGYVIDFLEPAFVRFAVFNVADICICAGAALVVLGMLAAELRKKKERAHGGV